MNLYIDIDRALLVAGPSNNGAVTQLSFKRGDAAVLQVTFQTLGSSGYTPVVLPTGTTFKFGLKEQGNYDGAFVVYQDGWTVPVSPATAYTLQPSFNTTPLNTLLDPGGESANDLPQVSLMGEIAWIDPSGNETSTRTFTVVVANDIIKDDEGVPSSGSPGYYTTAQADARFVDLRMGGIIALTVGQSAYTVDLTALGLTAAPRGALFTLITPTTAEATFSARMVTGSTTATSLAVQTDAAPVAANCQLAYLLIV